MVLWQYIYMKDKLTELTSIRWWWWSSVYLSKDSYVRCITFGYGLPLGGRHRSSADLLTTLSVRNGSHSKTLSKSKTN
jgi:hypothetical protein